MSKSSAHSLPKLKTKSDVHLARKLWHLFGILTMVAVYHYYGESMSRWIVGITLALAIPFDWARQNSGHLNRIAMKLFGPLMRDHEVDGMSGLTALLIGTAIILLLFPRDIVTLSLLFLAIGDPFASWAGLKYGREKLIGSKTLQGTMAGFVACSCVAAVYFYLNGLMIERLFIVVPIAGLIGAASELVSIAELDDNLTAPVLSGIGLWLLFYVYGGAS